jgi:hypothetical protein
MENELINERILKVQKDCEIAPEQANLLELARATHRDVEVTLVVSPGEFSERPTEDGKFDSIYRMKMTILKSLEIV